MNRDSYIENSSNLEAFFNIALFFSICLTLYTAYEIIGHFNVLIGIFSALGVGSASIGSLCMFQRRKQNKWNLEYHSVTKNALGEFNHE